MRVVAAHATAAAAAAVLLLLLVSVQVELAQSEYQLPRLTRMWSHLERQSGSGQVKGMGEKQIEVDRRLLKGRMARLRRDIEEVSGHPSRRAPHSIVAVHASLLGTCGA